MALIGPNSSTCAPVGAMKRPSEVPPEVDSSVFMPTTWLMALTAAATSYPSAVKNGKPDRFHSISYVS